MLDRWPPEDFVQSLLDLHWDLGHEAGALRERLGLRDTSSEGDSIHPRAMNVDGTPALADVFRPEPTMVPDTITGPENAHPYTPPPNILDSQSASRPSDAMGVEPLRPQSRGVSAQSNLAVQNSTSESRTSAESDPNSKPVRSAV